MKTNFYIQGQSLIGIIIVLVMVSLLGGGLYYYFQKEIPGVPETPSDYCGNGSLDIGEECDDGNNISGDGCSTDCQIEKTLGEQEEEEEEEEEAVEIPDTELVIIDKFVSWGYKSYSGSREVDAIIIHSAYDALGDDFYSVDGVIEEFRIYKVTPHYLIDREGNIYQLVSDDNVAYHAGTGKDI